MMPEMHVLIDDAFDGLAFCSDSSPLNSANARRVAILVLCLVGVGGSALAFGVAFGVAFGFGAFTLTSGLVSGLRSTFFLGAAFLPGLLPRERLLAGRFLTWTICFLTSFALMVNMVPSSY